MCKIYLGVGVLFWRSVTRWTTSLSVMAKIYFFGVSLKARFYKIKITSTPLFAKQIFRTKNNFEAVILKRLSFN